MELVTDEEKMEQLYPLVNLRRLKFKERDDLEDIFKFWRNRAPKHFDMTELWDYRLRQYWKQRYDSRTNLADWDYSMKLKDLGRASVIHSRQFARWRDTGIAFDPRDAPYDVSNRTLASCRMFREKHGSVDKRGYWGDVVNSPYIGLGIECDDDALFKKQQDQHVRHAGHVAAHNVSQYVHEIIKCEEYNAEMMGSADTDPSVDDPKITEVAEDDHDSGGAQGDLLSMTEQEVLTIPLPGVQVTFLPLKAPEELKSKPKYHRKFDAAFVGMGMVHHLQDGAFGATLAPRAHLVLEGVQYVLGLRDEQKIEFATKVTSYAEKCGATATRKVNGLQQPHYIFKASD